MQARRQPGSLFKLFVYLAALRAGMSPDSPIEDAPLQIGEWRPRNYAEDYVGLTDVRTAFGQSLNSATVRVQEAVGREPVIALAQEMGISSPLSRHPSLALGSAEMTLLELTAAYAAVLANVGRVKPYVVRAVRAPGGATFHRQRSAPPRADWPRPQIMDLLLEAVRSGPAGQPDSTFRCSARPGPPRTIAMPGSSASPRISWSACGSAMTTTRRYEGSPAARCRRKSGAASWRTR